MCDTLLTDHWALRIPLGCPILSKSTNPTPPMPDTIKEFFTDSEWDLIYTLVDGNRPFCNDEEDPLDDYGSIIAKIHNLHKDS